MRLFLAIDLPPASKQKLHDQLKSIYQEYPYIRWVGQENFHITLHFFGEVNKADTIIKGMHDIVYDVPSFQLYSGETDLFIKNKITIYLGFARNKILEKLVEDIKARLAFPSEVKFIPHLALGRYRIPSKQQYLLLKKKIEHLKIDIDFTISHIILFESILETQKPVYKKVAKFSLFRET